MKAKSIHTLNARGNIMLEVVRDYFKLSPEHMFREIQGLRNQLEDALALKGIRYDDLKSALVPDRQRHEVALIFDTTIIDSTWYGGEVGDRILPLFSRDTNHSVLAGDYLDRGRGQDILFDAMSDAVTFVRPTTWRHSTQYYVIYINNLSETMIERFKSGLASYEGFVGLADTTYTSRFKILLSTMLTNAFLKHGNVLIQGHEDDRPNTEDVNMYGYPAEKYGYVCRSVQAMLEGPLLTYKIERPVFAGFETDTEFSLNAISVDPRDLSDFDVEVEEAKLTYLKTEKAGSLARAGLEAATASELAALIKAKVSASYIYSMSYDDRYGVAKFNVIIEVPSAAGPTRLLAALEYKSAAKKLRLITFF